MEFLVVVGLFTGAGAVALLGARGLLELIFYLMTHGALPVTIYWRPVVFTGALFWFWYLTPALVESRTVARVFLLLTQ